MEFQEYNKFQEFYTFQCNLATNHKVYCKEEWDVFPQELKPCELSKFGLCMIKF